VGETSLPAIQRANFMNENLCLLMLSYCDGFLP
jgi:hypothetical protein